MSSARSRVGGRHGGDSVSSTPERTYSPTTRRASATGEADLVPETAICDLSASCARTPTTAARACGWDTAHWPEAAAGSASSLITVGSCSPRRVLPPHDAPADRGSHGAGVRDEAHAGASARSGNGAKKVEAFNGRLEEAREHRIAVSRPNRRGKSGVQEAVAPDIDAVTGSEEDVVGDFLAPVGELQSNAPVHRGDRSDGCRLLDRNPGKPRPKPGRAGRPDRSVGKGCAEPRGERPVKPREPHDKI